MKRLDLRELLRVNNTYGEQHVRHVLFNSTRVENRFDGLVHTDAFAC